MQNFSSICWEMAEILAVKSFCGWWVPMHCLVTATSHWWVLIGYLFNDWWQWTRIIGQGDGSHLEYRSKKNDLIELNKKKLIVLLMKILKILSKTKKAQMMQDLAAVFFYNQIKIWKIFGTLKHLWFKACSFSLRPGQCTNNCQWYKDDRLVKISCFKELQQRELCDSFEKMSERLFKYLCCTLISE